MAARASRCRTRTLCPRAALPRAPSGPCARPSRARCPPPCHRPSPPPCHRPSRPAPLCRPAPRPPRPPRLSSSSSRCGRALARASCAWRHVCMAAQHPPRMEVLAACALARPSLARPSRPSPSRTSDALLVAPCMQAAAVDAWVRYWQELVELGSQAGRSVSILTGLPARNCPLKETLQLGLFRPGQLTIPGAWTDNRWAPPRMQLCLQPCGVAHVPRYLCGSYNLPTCFLSAGRCSSTRT